ncbi:gamma-aminobutyric acid type B receptor subunit 2-like [Glandiceps talaboti]
MSIIAFGVSLILVLQCIGVDGLRPRHGSVATEELNFAAMFPFTTDRHEGEIARGVKPAIDLAIQHINNSSLILPGYKLNMEPYDTKCDMAVGTKALFDAMVDRPPKLVVLGGICPNVTAPIAEAVSSWKLIQISYANTEPFLSEREKYPTFFRTVPSETDFIPATVKLLGYFNWTRVASIHHSHPRFSLTQNKMSSVLDTNGIRVDTVAEFDDDPTTALQAIKDSKVRIILGYFEKEMAQKVFCQIYRERLFGDKYVWILPGWYTKEWLNSSATTDVECTVEEMNKAAEGYIATDLLPLSTNEEKTISGLSAIEYQRQYDKVRGGVYHLLHGYAYDGVWVIATVLDRILHKLGNTSSLTAFQYDNDHEVFDLFMEAMNETAFTGVTGMLKFNNGDRLGTIILGQYQGGQQVKIGEYHAYNGVLDLNEDVVLWRGGSPPRDRPIIRRVRHVVSLVLYIGVCSLGCVGIILALIFLFFNLRFRNHRYVKMSSPYINNLIIVGAILCYFSIFTLGLDGRHLSENNFDAVCTLQAWLLALGFTLAYGAMFAKTWRVYSIFTDIKLKKKIIKDSKLFGIVGALVFVDLLILLSWGISDPLKRIEEDGPLQSDTEGRDITIIPIMQYCRSNKMTIWLSAIYVYKGVLMVFGCFLAWETRHVSIPALNDSKYIGMSVYNVVVMCTVGAALSFFIPNNPDASFGIISVFILFSTTVTLCLVFIPKLHQLKRDPVGEERKIRCTTSKASYKISSTVNNSIISVKYHKLKAENLELHRILTEKDREITSLLEKLKPDHGNVDKEDNFPNCLPDTQPFGGVFIGVPLLEVTSDKAQKVVSNSVSSSKDNEPKQDSVKCIENHNNCLGLPLIENKVSLAQLIPLLRTLRETDILSDSSESDFDETTVTVMQPSVRDQM